MKKFFIVLILFFYLENTFAELAVLPNCQYKGELEECVQANSKEGAGNRTIQDFICISSKNEQQILSQIVLDKEFKKVDKMVEAYIGFLENNKDYYFGKNSQESFLKAVDDIDKKFSETGEYGKKYLDLCNPGSEDSILNKILSCYPDGTVYTGNSKDYFIETDCRNLSVTKMEIAKQVSYDILKLNKHEVRNDEKRLNKQGRRTKYNKLMDVIMINIGYVERIWKKWPSKTKNPSNGGL